MPTDANKLNFKNRSVCMAYSKLTRVMLLLFLI